MSMHESRGINGLHVQYGSGVSAPRGWVNFDASPTLRLQRIPLLGTALTRGGPDFPRDVLYGDIVKGLPIARESCAVIYCSHVLEHLALEDFRVALRNTYGHLEPGGIFRMVLPDLRRHMREYQASTDPAAAMIFMEQTLLGHRARVRGLGGLLRAWLGNDHHLWMWDFESMELELASIGFEGIRRAEMGDSPDPMLKEVEDPGRWNGQLGVECVRPEA